MMKHWYPLALAALLLSAPSCSDKEDPTPDPQDVNVVTDETSGAAQDPVADSTSGANGPGENETPNEGNGEEDSSDDSSGSSLRGRMEVSEAPPVDDQPWSTAMTLEERIASLEKSMSTGTEPYVVDMHDLGGWEFDEGKEQPFPDHVLALDGMTFTIRGFMMPDIDFENIRKFHLVRSLFSCCFGAPPQLNEILRVTLADEDGMEYTYNTVEVTGTLRVVFEMEDGLVEDLFRLENTTYRIIDFDDPEAPSDFDAATGFGDFIPQGPAEF
ncbi:MAG: DUF3299 domain-containing protein [Planctomycetes bacterium]|nr:DUF3299 domain-containing protein [Planctomycetota bacterium]MCP4772073.1 DUF3299 domain-containing protein [Planctomycetota bacterium]MCP4860790.1 DUF3299 domain-containing protein [Planctomycetota bacterium]